MRSLNVFRLSIGALVVAAGCSGSNGATGPTGPEGPPGEAGAPGATGATGATGPSGTPGLNGEAGATGAAGEAGAAGAAGEAGAAGAAGEAGTASAGSDLAAAYPTASKIKHVVVVFGENISFDHYFGTYPTAQNNPGETPFIAAAGTPTPNNLVTPLNPSAGFAAVTGVDLLNDNPNFTNAGNGAGAANPFRLGVAQASTEDMGHSYKPEQQASDNGAMDLFPKYTGAASPPPPNEVPVIPGDGGAVAVAQTTGQVMAYFDGNTVNTFWNLAQNGALNDNSWTSVFGPSTPGAINLISGQTHGIVATNRALSLMSASHVTPDGTDAGTYTQVGDTDPLGDVCSTAADQTQFGSKNVGDLLNAAGITWGWFEGGFDLTVVNANGTTGCNRETPPTQLPSEETSTDYIQHHEPFQFYASTANYTHARPSSVERIGYSTEADGLTKDPANHQYDTHDFFDALRIGNFPAVSYLKAPAYQDGHPGYSDPVDEQTFVDNVMTALESSPDWSTTLVVFSYDDSDGWYDHQAPPIVNQSASAQDFLNGTGVCNSGAQQGDGGAPPATPLLGVAPDGGVGVPVQGRCGYGTRIPLLLSGPFVKKNYVDHTLTDQSSVLKFVEDNWLGGERIEPGGSFDTIAGPISNMLVPSALPDGGAL
jgi:phospholipase C